MDDERIRSAADAAEVMVAGQDPFPAPAEAGPRAAAAVVAGFAQAAAVELAGAAGAAEGELLLEWGTHEPGPDRSHRRVFSRSAARRCPLWEGLPGSAAGASRVTPLFTYDK